eukprot:TRINITY_DN120500_c0_g1_i1.p1 TRINITY_DN120500_c0_g1~~TRINITY_DN120500_c0_g1_i1.p1  ORF type:complete len:433 (+),score=25.76 TRINITY_DN120500_c0_g1_i1:107-1300(+)
MKRWICLFLISWSIQSYTKVCDLGKYGAPFKNKEKDSEALKKALEECKEGGTILFPKGEYILKPFNFTSHQTLRLAGAYIHASTDLEDWPVVAPLPSYGGGREILGWRYSSFISTWNAVDVAIVGEGIIDGHGMSWWYKFFHGTLLHTRGRLIEFLYSKNILVEGVELRYSPYWTIHPYDSEDIVIQRIKIYNPVYGANTDGVDPDSSRNVLIRDSVICTGDDHIAIKSGVDEYGRRYGKPSENITVANCTFETGYGVTIGSEVGGGVRNVLVENCTFWGCTWAVKFKAGRDDGSVVENIKYNNISLSLVGMAISLDMHYRTSVNDTHPPVFRNLTFQNIHGFAFKAGHVACLEQSHCKNLRLDNVDFYSLLGYSCEYVDDPIVNNVHPKFCHQLIN